MKIINYNYGYIPAFECSIHGKIEMTAQEWTNAIRYILKAGRRWLPSYPWVISRVKEDITRGVKTKRGTLYNIRVPATEAVAEKYGLKKYKRANYMILVKTHELKISSLNDAMADCICGWHYVGTGERTRAEIQKLYRQNLK